MTWLIEGVSLAVDDLEPDEHEASDLGTPDPPDVDGQVEDGEFVEGKVVDREVKGDVNGVNDEVADGALVDGKLVDGGGDTMLSISTSSSESFNGTRLSILIAKRMLELDSVGSTSPSSSSDPVSVSSLTERVKSSRR